MHTKLSTTILLCCLLTVCLPFCIHAQICGTPGGGGGGGFQVSIPRSFDPNEMAGPRGFGGDKRYVVPGQTLEYTVYFENVSTAAAAAQQITIDANLSEYLDWTSFEFGEIVLAGQTMAELRGRQTGEALVPLAGRSDFVKIQLTCANGHLKVYMRSYDKTRPKNGYWPEDDYDGILKPNDDTGRGEGHFTYRISVKDKESLAEVTEPVITAAAEIVFDENEMIPTDPAWYNTVYDDKPMAVTETDFAEGSEVPLDTTSVMWKDGGGAENFDVTFWQRDKAGNVLDSWTVEGLPSPYCKLPMTLQPGGHYRWQINSRNGNGATQSAMMAFQVELGGDALSVTPGWNLLAVTRQLTANSEASLLLQQPWVLDSANGVFAKASGSWLGMPFWLYVHEAGTVVFDGEESPNWTLEQPAEAGWHLRGIVSDNAMPLWATSVWEWKDGRYVVPQSRELLKRGHAYWLYAPQAAEHE